MNDLPLHLLTAVPPGLLAFVLSFERTSMSPRLAPGRRLALVLGAGAAITALLALLPVAMPLLIASGIALGVLLGGVVTDLRERTIDTVPVLFALPLTLVLGIIGALDGQPLAVVAGLVTALALSGLMWVGGRLFARARRAPIDPTTGEQTEDFGTGDVYEWALVGAWLGALAGPIDVGAAVMLVLSAFVAQVILNGVISVAVLARASRREREGDIHLPLLPSIVLAVVGVVVWRIAL